MLCHLAWELGRNYTPSSTVSWTVHFVSVYPYGSFWMFGFFIVDIGSGCWMMLCALNKINSVSTDYSTTFDMRFVLGETRYFIILQIYIGLCKRSCLCLLCELSHQLLCNALTICGCIVTHMQGQFVSLLFHTHSYTHTLYCVRFTNFLYCDVNYTPLYCH